MAAPTYPANVREFARRLHAAGYSPYRIRKSLLGRGYSPSENTIRCWVDPEHAEQRRLSRRNGRRPGPVPVRGYRRRLARMQELRSLGVSYRALAAVMSNDFEDVDLTEGQVRGIFNGWSSEETVRKLLWPKTNTPERSTT